MDPIQLMFDYDIDISGIIHVGANVGQERFSYRDALVKKVLFIEPITSVFSELKRNIAGFDGFVALQALCSETTGEKVRFNIANNGGESSSMFGLGAHAAMYPNITYTSFEEMRTVTLDSILADQAAPVRYNMLVVDTQGADLKVLKGAASVLGGMDTVYVEVSEKPLYEGGCTLDEISAFMLLQGFRLKWLQIYEEGWGNAFYVHDRVFAGGRPLPDIGPNIALNRPASQSSTCAWSTPDDAQGGVNGVISGTFSFHTDIEDCPWWQVDLQSVYNLKEVRIYNRFNGCLERANTLLVLISVDGESWTAVHDQKGRGFGSRWGRPLRVGLAGEEARFLRVQLNARNYLHLDEVEVYAC